VIHVRGTGLGGAVGFVKRVYGGAAAHEAVLARLEPQDAAAFVDLRPASWKPLRCLAAYIEAARALHSRDDAAFYYELGFFIGQFARHDGGFQPMLTTPEVAMRMAPLVWKAVYDAGRMEFEIEGREGGVARVHEFPARPALCAVNTAIIEGLASSDGHRARVTETRCRLRGSEFCQYDVRWP
jgi:hypothetical protein